MRHISRVTLFPLGDAYGDRQDPGGCYRCPTLKLRYSSLHVTGSCHILYTNFTSEESQITAPIYGRHSNPIGQVTFNYLVIRPLQTKVLDMSKSRHYHWQTGDTKEVGHRGMGKQ